MNNRLYRSTSENVFGGVAAGIARHFNIDPILVRIGFVLGTFLSNGLLLLVYLLLWAVLPTAASTATEVGDIVRENVNEFTSRLRPAQVNNEATSGTVGSTPRQGLSNNSFAWILIVVGGFFALNAMHLTRWPLFWPVVLIAGGIWLLNRNRA